MDSWDVPLDLLIPPHEPSIICIYHTTQGAGSGPAVMDLSGKLVTTRLKPSLGKVRRSLMREAAGLKMNPIIDHSRFEREDVGEIRRDSIGARGTRYVYIPITIRTWI